MIDCFAQQRLVFRRQRNRRLRSWRRTTGIPQVSNGKSPIFIRRTSSEKKCRVLIRGRFFQLVEDLKGFSGAEFVWVNIFQQRFNR